MVKRNMKSLGAKSEKLWPLSRAAPIAGINLNTVRDDITKGLIRFEDREWRPARAQGGMRLVSEVGIVRLAIMSRLRALGVAPVRSWEATADFLGISDVLISRLNAHEKRTKGRDAKKPYVDGTYFLVVPALGTPRIINVKDDATIRAFIGELGRNIESVVVNVSAVASTTLSQLAGTPAIEG
jgi:hypothetical protein